MNEQATANPVAPVVRVATMVSVRTAVSTAGAFRVMWRRTSVRPLVPTASNVTIMVTVRILAMRITVLRVMLSLVNAKAPVRTRASNATARVNVHSVVTLTIARFVMVVAVRPRVHRAHIVMDTATVWKSAPVPVKSVTRKRTSVSPPVRVRVKCAVRVRVNASLTPVSRTRVESVPKSTALTSAATCLRISVSRAVLHFHAHPIFAKQLTSRSVVFVLWSRKSMSVKVTPTVSIVTHARSTLATSKQRTASVR